MHLMPTAYWEVQKVQAIKQLADEEDLDEQAVINVIERIEYTNQEPLREDVVSTMRKPPSVLQRRTVIPRIADKFKQFVNTFYKGMQ